MSSSYSDDEVLFRLKEGQPYSCGAFLRKPLTVTDKWTTVICTANCPKVANSDLCQSEAKLCSLSSKGNENTSADEYARSLASQCSRLIVPHSRWKAQQAAYQNSATALGDAEKEDSQESQGGVEASYLREMRRLAGQNDLRLEQGRLKSMLE